MFPVAILLTEELRKLKKAPTVSDAFSGHWDVQRQTEQEGHYMIITLEFFFAPRSESRCD